MEIEPITFGKGLNLRRSPLMLQDGELVTCEGFSFSKDGEMTARDSVQTVNTTAIGSINAIHRYSNHVIVGDGGNIRYKWDLDGYCDNYVPPNGDFTFLGNLASSGRWRTADYSGFTFIAMQGDMYAFNNGYYFNCSSITSPSSNPTVTSSGGSGAQSVHTWYYTYVYRFKNGHQYESGLSPSYSQTVYATGQTATITAFNSTKYTMSGSIPINGGIDIYAVAVYHFDGADQGTTITDSSIGGTHSGTCSGGAELDTAQKKFGESSLALYETSSSCVTISDSAEFDFSSGDWTIDFWAKFSQFPDMDKKVALYYHGTDSNNYCVLYAQHTSWMGTEYMAITWDQYASGSRTGHLETLFDLSQFYNWNHIAISSKYISAGNRYWYVFLNGISGATFNNSTTPLNFTGDVYIGGHSSIGYMNGWIDELRITKGIPRWITSFSVATEAYSGDSVVSPVDNNDGVDVFWKAYKTSDSIGNVYECYDGIDKYSLSATDTYDDSTVLNNSVCTTTNYGPWPSGIIDVAVHLQRLFGIKDNEIYYSEPYLPFAVDAFNNIAVTPAGENLTSVVEWGGSLFIASAPTWHRLNGTSDDTWSVVATFSDVGTINRHTVKKALQGIVSLYHDGIYLFDGFRSRNISDQKLGRAFFDAITSKSSCFAEFHNNKYYFYYPSTGTTCNKCMMIDFTSYPDLKYYYDNFVPNAFEFHVPTGIKYYGDTNGYQYEEGGSEVIPTALQTGDKGMKNVLQRKQLQYLFHDINTGGKDVTVSVYVDGVSAYSFTLNKTSRIRSRKLLPKLEGHRFSVYLSCTDSSGLYIYEPWGFGYSFAGE